MMMLLAAARTTRSAEEGLIMIYSEAVNDKAAQDERMNAKERIEFRMLTKRAKDHRWELILLQRPHKYFYLYRIETNNQFLESSSVDTEVLAGPMQASVFLFG